VRGAGCFPLCEGARGAVLMRGWRWSVCWVRSTIGGVVNSQFQQIGIEIEVRGGSRGLEASRSVR
jgi:hypothetical protein